MKEMNNSTVLIIYDSDYGNTAKLAQVIAKRLKHIYSKVETRHISLVTEEEINKAHLLIIGSPTQGGRATQTTLDFLHRLGDSSLIGKKVAAFDTRFGIKEHGIPLRLLMQTIGFAAPKIAKVMQQKGATLVIPPEGFIVHDKEGPLKNGELLRAASWADQLSAMKIPA